MIEVNSNQGKIIFPDIRTQGKTEFILKPADIFFTASPTLFNSIIRYWEKDYFKAMAMVGHTGLIVTGGTIRTAEAVEALLHVERHTLLSQYGGTKTKVAIFRPLGLTDEQRQKVADKAMSYVGKNYGWEKLIPHLLDHTLGGVYLFRRLNSDQRYPICSWVLEWAFHEIGWGFGVPLGSTDPDDAWDYCIENKSRFDCIRMLRTLEVA